MPKDIGFTLIEILMATLLIAFLAIIGIPNLRKFNEDQDLDIASSDLIQALKRVQSNAQSGIKCTSYPTIGWSLSITQSGYTLKNTCQDKFYSNPPVPITEPQPTKNYLPTTVRLDSNNCGSGVTGVIAEIFFTTSGNVSIACANATPIIWPFTMTLKNSKNTPSNIIIENGGNIHR